MKNILLVDDDVLLKLVLLSTLRSHLPQCHMLTAENGREAVEILRSLKVDFMLTDLRMEEMDGYELIEYVKANYPSLPLAVMSGDGRTEVKERLECLGISSFFEKPFSVKELEAVVCGELRQDPGTVESLSLNAA
jgi:CheY-like chemotaxis protein